ncbi:hypothetical protein COR50_19390 [Chitinophaga caeni]|uniref:DUF3037 domain-containing protein n=1 Tax=Chitinophaga caeni TaxID=2029983 RepID=A0A291QZ87_9BACT|nr:DUF3037 domain-containing protein [Chitinophaga caeni]ATL49164.1 hypothetical protein COR50_19390 [Chitinophaga caeni]
MQGKHLYEYAIIRLMPRVERGEFLNIGVILYCKPKKFLRLKFVLNVDRLRVFGDELDLDDLRTYLQAIERICQGDKTAGPIAGLDLPSRFRWLTATRSTILQTSRSHAGFCDDPQQTMERLFVEYVL